MYTVYKCAFCGFVTDFEPANCHICGSEDFKQEQRKITNADRIRSMSDDELAKWLEMWGVYPFDADGTSWTEWLKQEVE